MKNLKIKPIKNVMEARNSFNFFKNSFLQTSETETNGFLPLHEIYQAMVDNLALKKKTQYYASIDDQVVGCIIGVQNEITTNELYLPIFAVDKKFRKTKIATTLLEELERKAKKLKYSCLKVKTSNSSSGFFFKAGFSLFLYVKAPNNTIDEIKKANKDNLEIVKVYEENNCIKFATQNYDEQLTLNFKEGLSNPEMALWFEKKI